MLRRFNHVLMPLVAGSLASIALTEQQSNDSVLTTDKRLLSSRYAQNEVLKQIAIDCKEREHLNIYDTPAHRVLLTSIHNKCDLLVKDRFVGRNGSHARIIHGPKGVGKSTILESYAKLCSFYHPKIVPFYISLDDLNSKENQLEQRTIMEYIFDHLTSEYGMKIDSEQSKEYLSHRIVSALQSADKYILLIVDELEEVYRTSDVNPQRTNRLHMLGDLKWLGCQKSGRFAVYLCGSSSNCPLLVTCHASKNEFPLLSDAPHLNGTKYNTLRLPVSPFTDLSAINNIICGYFDTQSPAFINGSVNRDELARLVAFGVGAIPRSVHALCVNLEEGENELFCHMRREAYSSGVTWYHDTSMPLIPQNYGQIAREEWKNAKHDQVSERQ